MKKEMLIDQLVENGWFCQENFLSPSFCSELLKEAENLEWRQAKIGTGAQQNENLTIRNDSIFWIDNENPSTLQKEYLAQMHELMLEINRSLYLGLKEFECHFAHYTNSGFYKKHLDQHQGKNVRAVSAISYLNQPTEGGELVIYKKENADEVELKIKPKAGTFVCFLSNQIYHEVLPTKGDRYSLAGWFRTSVN